MKEKTGIIDVGGGLRGVYAAGVLDRCMDDGLNFDLAMGVSAGSANLASLVSRQPRRNLPFYTEYAMRREYMSVGNYLRRGSFIDLDYVYGTLSNTCGEAPVDYPAFAQSPTELVVVATDARTGKPHYFTKADIRQDQYDAFKASCALPVVCRPYVVEGVPYFDGALSDPVPVRKAFDLGCQKVVLILTLPLKRLRIPEKDRRKTALLRRRWPHAAAAQQRRAETYNAGVALARQYAAQGKVLIVAPEDTCGVSTLTRDVDALNRLYERGYADGGRIGPFLNRDGA